MLQAVASTIGWDLVMVEMMWHVNALLCTLHYKEFIPIIIAMYVISLHENCSLIKVVDMVTIVCMCVCVCVCICERERVCTSKSKRKCAFMHKCECEL